MEQAKEILIKHLKALPIGYNETEILQCLNDKKSEEGMLLNAMLNAVTEALNIHSVSGLVLPTVSEIRTAANEYAKWQSPPEWEQERKYAAKDFAAGVEWFKGKTCR